MILTRLLNALNKTAEDESVKYLGGAPTVNAKKKDAQTSHSHTYIERERKVKKQKNGLNDTVKSFMNRSRSTLVCSVCNTTYYEGALDFLSDEPKSCPSCDNGKDE